MQSHNLQAKLDESTAIGQRLREELQRLGKNVDGLLSEKGTMSRSLEDAKQRLEELRKAQAATEARHGSLQAADSEVQEADRRGAAAHRAARRAHDLAAPQRRALRFRQAAVKQDGQRALGKWGACSRR